MAAPRKNAPASPKPKIDRPAYKSDLAFKKATKPKEIKIEMAPAEEIDKKKYYCSACGREYAATLQDKNFPFSNSPFYKNNNQRLTICNYCFEDAVEQYAKILGSEDEAIKRMCLHFDMYLDERVLGSSRKMNKSNSRIKQYIRLLNLSQNNGKTYDTYLSELPVKDFIMTEEDIQAVIEEEKGVSAEFIDIEKSAKIWGFGFTKEDYAFLEEKFLYWKKNCIVDGTREKYVRDLCVMNLLQNKALINNDLDLYQKLTNTSQTTLKNASLTPKIEDEIEKNSEKSMGVMIKEFEEKKPIPEPLPEWRDVDGIMRVVLVYFIGHLCKMIGLNNRYARMYEAEMDKYRPKMENPDTADSEEIFEFLLDSGFDGVALSSGSDDKFEGLTEIKKQKNNSVSNKVTDDDIEDDDFYETS